MSMIHRRKRRATVSKKTVAVKNETKETKKEEKHVYTRTEIGTMRKDDLVKLATEVGIENPNEKTNATLKSLLNKHYGL